MTQPVSTREKVLSPESIEPGKIHKRHVSGDAVLKYFIYIPENRSTHTSQFVSVHGISRNAREHAELFAPLAEQYGVVLVAPVFSKRHFGDYQRLGREGGGRRADHALQMITEEIEYLTGAVSSKIFLTGFSGGGQFAHRYTMAYPERVQRLAICAAGWYTCPDGSRRFPFGIVPTPRLKGVDFDMQKFLCVPTAVFVGQWDIMHDPGLNRSARIQQQQGFTRLERGRRWVAAMNRVAMEHDIDASCRFTIIPGVGHDFRRAMKNGQLGLRVFRYLFSISTNRHFTNGTCLASDRHRLESDRIPMNPELATGLFS